LGCESGAATGRRAKLLTAAQGQSLVSQDTGAASVTGAQTGRFGRGGQLTARADRHLDGESLVSAGGPDASFASHVVGDSSGSSRHSLPGDARGAGRVGSISKQDVLAWTARGVPEEAIIDRIQSSSSVFVLTAVDETELRDRGVSEAVIRALRDALRR
jgi:hypothetical protein